MTAGPPTQRPLEDEAMVTEINRVEVRTIEIDAKVWRWFVGIGGALALLGLLASANLVLATVAAAHDGGHQHGD